MFLKGKQHLGQDKKSRQNDKPSHEIKTVLRKRKKKTMASFANNVLRNWTLCKSDHTVIPD